MPNRDEMTGVLWLRMHEGIKSTSEVRSRHNTNSVGSSCLKAMIVNQKVSTNGDEIDWLNVYRIRAKNSSPFSFKDHYTLNTLEEWKLNDRHLAQDNMLSCDV